MLHRVHLVCAGFELTTLVVIGTDCTGSFKSNYYAVLTTTTPMPNINFCTVFYRSLSVFLSFSSVNCMSVFFFPLYCLYLDLRPLITSLLSSNLSSSSHMNTSITNNNELFPNKFSCWRTYWDSHKIICKQRQIIRDSEHMDT